MRPVSLTAAIAASALTLVSAKDEPCAQAFAFYNGATSFEDVATPLVPANLALACLQSMPFDSQRALNWIDLWNTTMLQSHTGTAYIRDPPPSYQKPSADLNGILHTIKDKASNGSYTNQYDFESDVQDLIHASHDGHLGASLGGSLIWFFYPQIQFVSLSRDGISLPDLYAFDDLDQLNVQSRANSFLDWKVSVVQKINGQDAAEFIQSWTAQWLLGMIESHGEWNNAMHSQVLGGTENRFEIAHRYVGDWLNVTFTNGSVVNTQWLAGLNTRKTSALTLDLVKSIKSGKDMYDALVIPAPTDSDTQPTASLSLQTQNASTVTASLAAEATSSPTSTPDPYAAGWGVAYPEPFLLQNNFSLTNPSSGYILEDESMAVLSLPSFNVEDHAGFQKFLRDFVDGTKKRDIKRLLIDTRGNPGGLAILAYEMYKIFFPENYPWGGARARYNPIAEILGNAASQAWDNSTAAKDNETNSDLVAIAYTPQALLDAETGQHFQNWDALSNPYFANGDWFMKNVLWDLNNSFVDYGVSGIVLDGFGSNLAETTNPQPFAVENMVLLTDGICHSTCSTFYELFKHQLNVTTIGVGGVPVFGPMQDVAGVRGSVAGEYDMSELVFTFFNTAYPQYLSSPLPQLENTFLRMPAAGYNEWDQIRANETFPQQFAYHAVDCRIFYTFDTYFSHAALWLHAADVAFNSQDACVPGSTGQISALQPYYTDVCGPFAKDCDPNMGFQRWGTSNHSVYSSDFYPTRFTKDENAKFGDTFNGDSENQIYSSESIPLTASHSATTTTAASPAPTGGANNGVANPSAPSGTASSAANASATPSQHNAAGVVTAPASAMGLVAFFAAALMI